MTSILPQIKELQEIPRLHLEYAKTILNMLVHKLLELEEFEVGVFGDNDGSIVSFDSDDFEDIRLDLRCKRNNFSLKIIDNTDGYRTSVFLHKIEDESELFYIIPEGLRTLMEEVATNFEPATFTKDSLK